MVDHDPRGHDDETTEANHPRENKGLIDRLKEMLKNPDNDPDMIRETVDHRMEQREVTAQHEALKVRALKELSNEAGVITADQDDIQRKMQEIAARDAQLDADGPGPSDDSSGSEQRAA